MTSKDIPIPAGYRKGRDGASQAQETKLKKTKIMGVPSLGYAVAVCSQCGTSHQVPIKPDTVINGFRCRTCGFQHTDSGFQAQSQN